jgi:hypothetical protein
MNIKIGSIIRIKLRLKNHRPITTSLSSYLPLQHSLLNKLTIKQSVVDLVYISLYRVRTAEPSFIIWNRVKEWPQ